MRKRVNCEIETADGVIVVSIPDVLGALVLKGAAHKSDNRDRERHLDDAAVLSCTVDNPIHHRVRMIGHDRSRIQHLWAALQDPTHRAWIAPGERWARRGRAALQVLAANPG